MLCLGGTLKDCGTKGKSEDTIPGVAQYMAPVISLPCHLLTDWHVFGSLWYKYTATRIVIKVQLERDIRNKASAVGSITQASVFD